MVHLSNDAFVAQVQALLAAAHTPAGGTLFLTQKRGACSHRITRAHNTKTRRALPLTLPFWQRRV